MPLLTLGPKPKPIKRFIEITRKDPYLTLLFKPYASLDPKFIVFRFFVLVVEPNYCFIFRLLCTVNGRYWKVFVRYCLLIIFNIDSPSVVYIVSICHASSLAITTGLSLDYREFYYLLYLSNELFCKRISVKLSYYVFPSKDLPSILLYAGRWSVQLSHSN